MLVKCSGTNVDGTPCSATPRPGSAWCVWHDPATKAQRTEWAKRGGKARSNAARAKKALPTELMTSDEIAAWLTIQFRKLITGQIEPGIATASATVAKAIADIQRGAQIEERIAELEALLGTGKRPA